MHNGLLYSSRQELHLGDHIRVRRFLRSPLEGTIQYLTGESPRNDAFEYENEGRVTFSVRGSGNAVVTWTWPPGTVLASRFELLSRAQAQRSGEQ